MKIKLLFLIGCFIILFSGVPQPSFIVDTHKDKIITLCEVASDGCRDALIYCLISEFYAMGKLDDIYNKEITSEEHQKLKTLFGKYYFPEPLDTYDFVEILIEYEEWKKENIP